MNILGLNYFYHDSTACVVSDGKLIVAIEEERLSRVKHTYAFPYLSIKKTLEVAKLGYADIDSIAVSIKPTLHWPAKLWYGLKNLSNAKPFISHELIRARYKQKEFWEWYTGIWPDRSLGPKVYFIPHHLTHAAGSFFVSPYESAALLALDGSGEWATSLLGKGEGNTITTYNQSFFPMSLGSFYESVTEFCGFKPNYDEGKTMGLAPLGDPSVFHDVVDKMVTVDSEGSIRIDLSYFNYQFWARRRCSQKFYDTFGQPRMGNEPFKDHHLNAAAAFQRVLEEKALQLSRILRARTGCRYLVVSGGVALNSVMNGRIVRESGFDDIYVMPAAGDNGTGIGAAYYVYNCIHNHPRGSVHNDPYVGNSYTNEQIKAVLDEAKLKAEWQEDVAGAAARLLHAGKIIGWFQGRMEIGPRSLGNRSILADPTRADMKDKVNAEVKHREAYRPFAPSVPAERKEEFFLSKVEAPFMLKVCDVRPDKRSVVPAITHVDGSARLQTVRKEINPLYHELLTKFGELSKVPVLLNTSFNVMGEPIVESPVDAVRCFYSTGLDALFVGNYLLRK
jgi:carbamoyltransferase